MNSETQILNITTNGIISKKTSIGTYEIVFKNMAFTFTHNGYHEFTNYIIDLKEMLEEHKSCTNCKCHEIEIPTGNKSLKLILTYAELQELEDLFALNSYRINLVNRLEYGFSLN